MSFKRGRSYKELLLLSKNEAIDQGDIDRSLNLITECLARTLGIARASIWLYNDDQTAIVCKDLYEIDLHRHSAGLVLSKKDFPRYFSYLGEERTLPAHDAFNDPATSEFTEVYLKPLDVRSLLDAPIRVNGKMVGVICCEQTKSMRTWTMFEESFVGNITDILARAFQARERAEAQNELRKLNLNLEETVRQRTAELKEILARSAESAKLISLGEMAGGIAHEVNTPLNSIIFAAESVRELISHETIDVDELKINMSLIEETSLRIAKIIQGLKWFAQDQRKQAQEIYDLRNVVDQALSLCQQRFVNGNIEVKWQPPPSETAAYCQPVQIGQVVLNLLNNAFDAASAESKGWIQIEIRSSETSWAIDISNSGRAIPKEVSARLFEPFFTTKPPGKGTGLGLSISRGIIRNHGGELNFNQARSTTCFTVTLPRNNQKMKEAS